MRKFAAIFLSLLAVVHAKDIKIAGSDLIALEAGPALEAFAQREDRAVSVALNGSYQGWLDLQSGAADIALISFPPDSPALDEAYHAIPIAWHTVVVLAPAALPVSQVSFAQLAGVFGADEGSAWKRWGDLGVAGELAARSVVPRAFVRPADMALELFRYRVLRNRPLGASLRKESDMARLRRQLASDEGGLALVAHAPADMSGLKTLAVAEEAGGVAFTPTMGAIERGDYPLQWPLYVVFRRAEVKTLYPYLRFLLGDEMAAALERAGLQPASAEARSGRIFGLEEL